MANEITNIGKNNAVTKQEFNDNFIYFFPTATIRTNSTNDAYQIIQINDYANPTSVKFNDVSDKFGQTTLEGYIDELANRGFFFDSEATNLIVEQEEDKVFKSGSGHVKTDFESMIRTHMKKQTGLLKEILGQLKSINN